MKRSTRFSLIVGCAALGALILVLIALQTIRSSMLEDHKDQIAMTAALAGNTVSVYLAEEKAGTLTREEAQAKAKQALSGMREGSVTDRTLSTFSIAASSIP